MAKKRKRRKTYRTSQIDLSAGEQLRITAGRRTVFVWCNSRGLFVGPGGYSRSGATTR